MPKTSQNFFLTPRGAKGGEYSGGTVGGRGASFLKICILGVFGDILSNLSLDRCQKHPKKVFDFQGGQGGE